MGGCGGLGWVVGPQDFHVIPWHFDNGASSKINDVLGKDAGLLQVLPFAVHLKFFLKLSYSLNFFVGPHLGLGLDNILKTVVECN